MNIAIIPARGGSKRIANKNIREFAGKPLIAYSIEVAKRSKCFDHVIVSTDSKHIAAVAKQYGADVPFMRPAELSDDYTGTTAVTRHAIKTMQALGFEFEYSCCIYATAPLLQPTYLREGLSILKNSPEKSFSFSASSFAFPIQRAIAVTKQGVEVLFPEHIKKLHNEFYFYEWNPLTHECRLMFSWDTPEENVKYFAKKIREVCV